MTVIVTGHQAGDLVWRKAPSNDSHTYRQRRTADSGLNCSRTEMEKDECRLDSALLDGRLNEIVTTKIAAM